MQLARTIDQPTDLPHQRSTVTTGTIDLLGVLPASQALNSETNIDRLRSRVVEVLGAMTGATSVQASSPSSWTTPSCTPSSPRRAHGSSHARSSAISVEVEIAGEVLRVTVRDDGVGGADFTKEHRQAPVPDPSKCHLPEGWHREL